MQKIKILIADDHRLFREGLCKLLETEEDIECVGMAANGDEAIDLARKTSPDVALLDIAMPKKNGIQAAQEIVTASPNTAVIIITAYSYDEYLSSSINAGIKGYLLKDTDTTDLIYAIRMVNNGRGVFDFNVSSDAMSKLVNREYGKDKVLKEREMDILKLISQGMSNREVGRILNISEHTVGGHLVKLYKKLGVKSRTEAVIYANKRGIVTTNAQENNACQFK